MIAVTRYKVSWCAVGWVVYLEDGRFEPCHIFTDADMPIKYGTFLMRKFTDIVLLVRVRNTLAVKDKRIYLINKH